MAGNVFPGHLGKGHPDGPDSDGPDSGGAAPMFPALAPVPDEAGLVAEFMQRPVLSKTDRAAVLERARDIARVARHSSRMFSAEKIMTVYKLSTAEGRMIMELAEALLRTPDSTTRDFLIFDKLAPGHWLQGDARGFFRGMEVALGLAGRIIRDRRQTGLPALVSRLGVTTVRQAIGTAMRQMGGQFVFAETIEAANRAAATKSTLYSFDMLGEAARSEKDCRRYHAAYHHAIAVVGAVAAHEDVNRNSGVSIKLSALSCRFATRYWSTDHEELTRRVVALAIAARRYNIPLTIDAEECGRLKPSLSLFARLLACPELQGWTGLGIVVQAYSRHAGAVIDWLEDQAREQATKIAVRLVKGAYWDAEIKWAQEKGLPDFPVFTSKRHTDLAYLALARRLMEASAVFHPQFASHNAYTLSAIIHLAASIRPASFELQKLHGMGDAVHDEFARIASAPLRVYAPVGQHQDLLAYLVRRILENGASSSFLNQLTDQQIDIETVISDPFMEDQSPAAPVCGTDLFAPARKNSLGFDIEDDRFIRYFETLVSRSDLPPPPPPASQDDIADAFIIARKTRWKNRCPSERADILNGIADAYEAASGAIFQLLVHEAGKTIDDAVAELREAVDFCRYYASRISHLPARAQPRGTVVAISPWNFPLAIFTGQITAALAAGNAVMAKPAEQTPRIAALAISLMHQAGVPKDALQVLCGAGAVVGHHLVKAGEADMVVFTGSMRTAKRIEIAIADSAKPHAALIAETGGINAMIVDSSALLERVVDDVLTSAFRSAGQRCSALRMLYIQEDIASALIAMICDAAAALATGDPARSDTDIGPVIDRDAKSRIDQHVADAERDGRLVWQGQVPQTGCFTPPSIIRVDGIADLGGEIFGPVLHVATYRAGGEATVIDAINRAGYGLTFGMHSRIDANIEAVTNNVDVGNIYINRNQIGAVVGSQPFGGHGLSGTGPKAGGDAYIRAFMTGHDGGDLPTATQSLPGPSGEMNSYSLLPRGRVLVIHPDPAIRQTLALRAEGFGNEVVERAATPDTFDGIAAVMTKTDGMIDIGRLRQRLHHACDGIIPLVVDDGGDVWLYRERHICRDMTASGGNIDLLMRQ